MRGYGTVVDPADTPVGADVKLEGDHRCQAAGIETCRRHDRPALSRKRPGSDQDHDSTRIRARLGGRPRGADERRVRRDERSRTGGSGEHLM